jgi:uroporphyrinogen-III synthase
MNTTRRLEEMGFSPIVLPLSQTRSLPIELADIPDTIDTVAITSVNAIRHAPRELVTSLARLPSIVVGAKTAAAAHQAGFFEVAEGPGDAAGLARGIIEKEKPGARIAYLTGHIRLETFEARLAEAGLRTFPIETYDTLAVDHSDAELARDFGNQPIDAILLYSSKSAEAVATIASRPQWHFHFAGAHYFCLSSRIAAKLERSGSDKVSIAAEPTEDALLALLASAF